MLINIETGSVASLIDFSFLLTLKSVGCRQTQKVHFNSLQRKKGHLFCEKSRTGSSVGVLESCTDGSIFLLTNISTATLNSVLCHVHVNIVTGSVFNVLSRVPFRSTTVAFNVLKGKRKQPAINHDANNSKNC